MPDENDPSAPPPRKKPRLTHTMATYQALVDAFRHMPGNYSRAAETVGCHRSAAKVAWERGWEKLGLPGAGPIKEVLANDKAKARVEAANRAQKERDLADADIAKKRAELMASLEQEAELMGSNRRGLLSLAKTVEGMARILPVYAFRIQEAVAQPDPVTGQLVPIKNPQVTLDQAMRVIQGVSLAANRLAYASASLVELARLDRGQSTVNVGDVDLSEPVEVLEELRAAASLFDRLQGAQDEASAAASEEPPEDSLH